MQKTQFPEGISSLIILQKLHPPSTTITPILVLLPIQRTLEEPILNEVHTIPKIPLGDDYLVSVSPLGYHTIDEEVLLLFVEFAEEEGVAEVEPDHDLSPFLFQPRLAEADRLATRTEHAVCLGTDSNPMLPDCLGDTLPTPTCELYLTDLLVQEGIVFVLSLSPIAILEESQGVLDNVLRTIECDLRDELLKYGLYLCFEVFAQLLSVLFHHSSVEIDYNKMGVQNGQGFIG